MRPTDLLIALDRAGGVPLQRQLFEALRGAILDGKLKPETRLPSSRGLSISLGIGRNTVLSAYEQLLQEGYVEANAGGGTRVAKLAPEAMLEVGKSAKPAVAPSGPGLSRRGIAMAAGRRAGISETSPLQLFRPGQPATEFFPFDLWSKLLAAANREPLRSAELTYAHAQGWPALREAIVAQFGAARGVVAEPGQVIVTTGSQGALALASHMLLDHGDPAWLEAPGYLGARGAFESAGARIVPVPIDGQGMDVAAGLAAEKRPHLIYATPSHQFPTGVTMSLPRRLALLEAATQADAWIVEDDYDSEFRYVGRPLSSLQGLDRRGRVIYVGTFAKTLFPALRIGFLIVPPDLATSFRAGAGTLGVMPALTIQMALARFISEGHYASHVRRMRLLYGARREKTADALTRHFGSAARFHLPDGGMQIAVEFSGLNDDRWLAEAGLKHQLWLAPLSHYGLGEFTRCGLHLGYAALPERMIDKAVAKLASLISPRLTWDSHGSAEIQSGRR